MKLPKQNVSRKMKYSKLSAPLSFLFGASLVAILSVLFLLHLFLSVKEGHEPTLLDLFKEEKGVETNPPVGFVTKGAAVDEETRRREEICCQGEEREAPRACMALAELAERRGEEEKALFLTLKAAGYGFHEPEPHFKAGVFFARCGNHREALAHFTEYARMVPGDPLVYRNMAIAQARLGSTEAATRSFDKYLKLCPDAFDGEEVKVTVMELEKER